MCKTEVKKKYISVKNLLILNYLLCLLSWSPQEDEGNAICITIACQGIQKVQNKPSTVGWIPWGLGEGHPTVLH